MSTRWEQEGPTSGPVVTGFSGRGFRVDGTVYEGVMLTPVAASLWEAPSLSALAPGDLQMLLDLEPAPEFLLLGTGAMMARPPRAFTQELERRSIGIEPMDSRAAARAWTVLRAEDRWIVAALMPL